MARASNRSFFTSGGKARPTSEAAWTPRVDKNPFYRTMDIFNGVFKKNIKLSAGKFNATDGHTIFVDFGELKPSKIELVVRDGKDAEHTIYQLECGHEWEGRKTDKEGQPKVPGKDWGMCGVCGADQIYRGFEHEWQHIIFKSDLAARKIFCEQYADQLLKQAPDVNRQELIGFLAMLTNAFDDIRVNSLWEKIYPGSAFAIWDRWRFYTNRMGDATSRDFIPFVFAVAFGLPTDPQGELEPMRPIVDWAVKKVKYRGFANMLIDIRVVLDRCMGALLADMKPPPSLMQPPPPPPAILQQGDKNGQAEEEKEAQQATEERGGEESQPDQSAPRSGDQDPADEPGNTAGSSSTSGTEDSDTQQAGAPSDQADVGDQAPQGDGAAGAERSEQGVLGIPSAASVKADAKERSGALSRLMKGAQELDPKEEHSDPTQEDLDAALVSQALRAMLAKALNLDISDLQAIDAKMPTGQVDDDMQKQLDQLQTSGTGKSEDSILTGNAKARVVIIDVTKDSIATGIKVELDEEQRYFVNRMRSAFFRTLGRQKAKRGPSGNQVDVQALIQYRGDHQDPNVFENEDINQGFAYSVLCDMSGSMNGTFPIVCQAIEMLKEALHFPFVVGNLWGFRGGEPIPGYSRDGNGEVWMYRYAKDVHWYKGTARVKTDRLGTIQVPVECGGITPMNSAINVATTHLWRRMPTGMAKRMFLLTDGSPIQTKVTGAQLPEFMLRQFVAKEIREARKHGIQVYTIVIGQHSIEEDKCLQMFGPRKFWRRVGHDRVGTALSSLVLDNFSKYIRVRG